MFYSQTDVNECASNPCLNNGTCLEISNQSLYPKFFIANFSHATAQGYVCDCPDGKWEDNYEIKTEVFCRKLSINSNVVF